MVYRSAFWARPAALRGGVCQGAAGNERRHRVHIPNGPADSEDAHPVVLAGESSTPDDERMTLTLRSPAFESGTPIPARFDHERGDLSPALIWDGVPEGAAGLVLLVDDPDAPVEGSFVHWVLYNLDLARQGVAEGEVPAEAMAGANGFGVPGYLGPAPPPGDDPHRYVFRLLAVDEPVSLKGLPSYQDVDMAVTGHTLGEARLIGTYQR
jgi:Raf kinase inhibitor-like YbhB/YbcL family protein